MDCMGIKRGGKYIISVQLSGWNNFLNFSISFGENKELCSVCIMFEISIKHPGRAVREQLQAFGSKMNVELYLLVILLSLVTTDKIHDLHVAEDQKNQC